MDLSRDAAAATAAAGADCGGDDCCDGGNRQDEDGEDSSQSVVRTTAYLRRWDQLLLCDSKWLIRYDLAFYGSQRRERKNRVVY